MSSLPQTKKISLEDQLSTNKEHIERHSGQLVAELVVPGESRSIVLFKDACRRIEAYAQLWELIDAKASDVLIYLDRSRLGRKASLSMAVVELCHEAGIATYETENPPALFQPNGSISHDDMLIGAIKSVGAQREIQKLQERHKMGMIGRIKRGEFPGAIPYGWRAVYAPDGSRTIQIDEEAAQIIRHILVELFLHRGAGRPQIASILNEMGYSTPQGKPWTKNHVKAFFGRVWRYAGFAEINKRGDRPYTRAPGSWPAIISIEEAQAILAEKDQRAKARRSVSNTYLFSLCVWCDECGQRMCMITKIRDRRKPVIQKSLRCKNFDQPHAHRYITENSVREAVREAIRYLETNENRQLVLAETETNGVERTKTDIAAVQKRMGDLHGALHKADDAYVSGHMDEERYQRQVDRLTAQIRSMEQAIRNLQDRLVMYQHENRRADRLEEIARIGLAMLENHDVKAVNAWLRRHFKIWARDLQVVRIDYL